MDKIANEDLGRLSVVEFKAVEKQNICLLLDNVRSMHNVGSAFRTSDAFLIDKIYLCGITAQPPHREIQKTALGATETVNWEYVNDSLRLANNLKEDGYKLYAVEQVVGSISLENIAKDLVLSNPNEKTALIFGNEVDGVNQELINLCDACIEIPQFGSKHSLNVSVSIGVVLWELSKYRKIE